MATDTVVLVAVSVGLFVVLVCLERTMNVVGTLVLSVLDGNNSSTNYPAMQAIGSFISIWTGIWANVLGVAVGIVNSLSSVFLWWVTVFVICGLFFVVYEEMPDVVREIGVLWNTFLGPILHSRVFLPLRMLQLTLEQIIPIFNAMVGVYRQVFRSVFLAGIQQQPVDVLFTTAEAFASIGGRLGVAISVFVTDINSRMYGCSAMGDACFEPIRFGFAHSMESVPALTSGLAMMVKGLCPVVLAPIDIILYPLMDVNVFSAIDSLLHSVVLLLLETPRITVQRCKLLQSTNGVMMCLPDVRRIFDELMYAARLTGVALDNWLDMSLVIVEAMTTGDSPSCAEKDKRLDALHIYGSLFGDNATAIAGISSSLVAITDGVNIQYIDTERVNGDVISRFGEGWPIEVDVTFGVAVVSLAAGADTRGESTGLLGCRCDDSADGLMQITCAVAPHFESTARNMPQQVFSADFQVPSTAEYMACKSSKINVQSIRWPATRYTTLDPNIELVKESRVDAAIWVMPLCGTVGPFPAACLGGDNILFTKASCFPYCMALHERASVKQNLVLFASREWEAYVHLLGRDCTMTGVKNGEPPTVPLGGGMLGAVTYLANGMLGSSVENEEWSGAGCEANSLARSLVPRAKHNAYKESYNSIRMEDQPFVFAGDVAVVGEYNDDDNVYQVTVYRLFGNSRNEYTMGKVIGSAPANPPLEMHSRYREVTELRDPPSKYYGDDSFDPDLFTLPFRFATSAFANNPAVQTQNAIFFAVNPSVHMFKAMFDWCDPHSTRDFPQAQLVIQSSYAPIQITRLLLDQRGNEVGAQSIAIEGAFTDIVSMGSGFDCDARFNVAVTQLEYLDPLNIVAMVANSPMSLASSLVGAEYKLGYLNPLTMQFRFETPWPAPVVHQPSNTAVHLCPSMRRMPNIGSFLAESTVALLFPFRFIPEVILGFIGMVAVWKERVDCPMVTHGHTQLERCGAELLSWDDFFSAVYRANRHAWRSLAFIAEFLVFPGSGGIQNALRGMNYFGAGMMRPFVTGTSQMVVRTMNTPVVDKLTKRGMSMIEISPNPMLATGKSIFGNPIGIAWYSSRVVTGIIMEIIPNAIRGDAGAALRAIWMHVYESQGAFRELVLADGYMACSGLSIMLGLNNPWAELTLHLCEYPLHATEGFIQYALALFVDTAFTGCLCVQSSGDNFYEYAMRECYTNAPKHLQPMIINWLQYRQADPRDVCAKMRTLMQYNIKHAMDPAFQSLMDAADALGGSVDYLRVVIDPDAGQCTNFDTDPFVVVLMPAPVDYFRACGSTSLCETRCGAEITAFEELSSGVMVRPWDKFTQTVSSKFFVTDSPDSYSPFQFVLSLREITCHGLSPARDCVGRCVAVLGIMWLGGVGSVRRYCVPRAPGQGAYFVSGWDLGGVDTDTWSMGRIVDDRAQTVFVVTIENGVGLRAAREGIEGNKLLPCNLQDQLPDLKQVLRILVYDSVLVMKVLINSGGSPEVQKICASCNGAMDCSSVQCWPSFSSPDLLTLASGHNVVWVSSSSLLLLPSEPSLESQEILSVELIITSNAPYVKVGSTSVVGETDAFTTDSGVGAFYSLVYEQEIHTEPSQRMAENTLSPPGGPYRIFSTDNPSSIANWLADIVIEPRGGGKKTAVSRRYSQPVDINVQIERTCDRSSCSGCVSLDVQRMCYAMQQCLVAKCVGTLVNQRHPLCAIGLTLKNLLSFSIQSSQGLWLVTTESVGNVLGLAFGDLEVEVSWPDDAFFSLVCVSKDATATAVSTLTATINNFVQGALSMPLGYTSAGATHVDGNLRVLVTMVLTALNNMLFQIALLPLYIPIVIQKIVICEGNSIMAFTDVLGLSVTIGNPSIQAATGSAIGQCLPERTATDVASMKGSGTEQKIAAVAVELLETMEHTVSNLMMAYITTTWDAFMSYFVGVITGAQDVAQTVDMAHCKMPDFYMNDVYKCACGDTAVTILRERREETAVDSAFWCSGTLRMLSDTGSEILVYNRHSLQDLSNLMETENVERYLLCLSRPAEFSRMYPESAGTRCETLRPSFSDIEMQGVETMAVWGRCRANYNFREWDPGAYAIFGTGLVTRSVTSLVKDALDQDVGACLLLAHSRGEGPKGCLQEFLARPTVGEESVVYFAYESAPFQHSSVWTDACQVFSGPAKAGSDMFKACLDEYDNDGCEIAPFVWSARSDNRVAAASQHAVITDKETRHTIANNMFTQAHALATGGLKEQENYENENLEVYLFSVEGDFLHQLFDCAVMGGLDRVDLWPRGALDALPVPSWWRSENGREIPECSASDIDDNIPPFTCGSQTRRGVMKDFVRRFFTGAVATNVTTAAIRSQIKALLEIWDDVSTYACLCEDNVAHSLSCCNADDEDSFTPLHLQTDFATVDSKTITDEITRRAGMYWEDLQTKMNPWWDHVSEEEKNTWQWSESVEFSDAAASLGIFSTSEPLLWYNGSETKGPFKKGNETLWQMCTGLVAQPMSTLPLSQNESGWFFANIDSVDFARGSEEAFVRGLFQISDVKSPLGALRDWRHVPSPSSVCVSGHGRVLALRGDLKLSGITFQSKTHLSPPANVGAVHGPMAYKLGTSDCSCGWYISTLPGWCRVPREICNKIGEQLSPEVNCNGNRIYLETNDDIVRSKLEVLTDSDWDDIPCPMLAFSDHWGVISSNAAASWLGMGTPGEDILIDAVEVLRHGRGGLRIPGWDMLTNATARHVKPTSRAKRLFAADTGENIVGQRFCTQGPDGPDALDERPMVPVAQIVHASLSVETCSTYVVEALKHQMMINNTVFGSSSSLAVLLHELSMQRWQQRCRNQLHLMTTCEHFGVFEVIPDDYVAPSTCPFAVTGGGHYVTSGCVVYLMDDNVFVDPCRCEPCAGFTETLFLESFLHENLERCRLPVDPRSMAQGWGAGVPQSFVDDLLQRVVDAEDLQPEGPSSEMPDSELCDGIVDWWPEAWTEPVGYHVTPPCHPSEAAYRVFDNTFAVERDVEGGPATIKYHADALRDPWMKSSNFGTCGMCRKTTYGMPLFDINPVRVCTQQWEEEFFDPTLARIPIQRGDFTEEKCSNSSHDVPWSPQEDAVGPEVSVGCLPMWDGVSSTFASPDLQSRIPEAGLSLGPGEHPSFFSNPSCTKNGECSGVGGISIQCKHGVCFGKYDAVLGTGVQCVRHKDCTVYELCSGSGVCEPSVIEMENRILQNVEWQVTAPDCGPDMQDSSFFTAGMSPWGQISHILDAHGFCGYHEWYEYQNIMSLNCPGGQCQNVTLGSADVWQRTREQQGVLLEDLEYLLLHPHVCDRDYTYAPSAMGCVPQTCMRRSLWYKTVDPSTSTVRLGGVSVHPALASSESIGFLGIPGTSWNEARFVRCDSVPQCSSIPFTWNMEVVGRAVPQESPSTTHISYTDDHLFKCSASMYISGGGGCVFDPTVVPFFNSLCGGSASDVMGKCNRRTKIIDERRLGLACFSLEQGYDFNVMHSLHTDIMHNAMFGVFNAVPKTLEGYFDAVACATELGAALPTANYGLSGESIRSQSVYYAFKYSLYEVPFQWWFKCSLLASIPLNSLSVVSNIQIVKCNAWDEQGSSIVEAESEQILQNADNVFDVLVRMNAIISEEAVMSQYTIMMDNIATLKQFIQSQTAGTPVKRNCFQGKNFLDVDDKTTWYLDPETNLYSRGSDNGYGVIDCFNSLDAGSPVCETRSQPIGGKATRKDDVSIVDLVFDSMTQITNVGTDLTTANFFHGVDGKINFDSWSWDVVYLSPEELAQLETTNYPVVEECVRTLSQVVYGRPLNHDIGPERNTMLYSSKNRLEEAERVASFQNVDLSDINFEEAISLGAVKCTFGKLDGTSTSFSTKFFDCDASNGEYIILHEGEWDMEVYPRTTCRNRITNEEMSFSSFINRDNRLTDASYSVQWPGSVSSAGEPTPLDVYAGYFDEFASAYQVERCDITFRVREGTEWTPDFVVDPPYEDRMRVLPRANVPNIMCLGSTGCTLPTKMEVVAYDPPSSFYQIYLSTLGDEYDIFQGIQAYIEYILKDPHSTGKNLGLKFDFSVVMEASSIIFPYPQSEDATSYFPGFDASANVYHERSLLKDIYDNIKCTGDDGTDLNIVYSECSFQDSLENLRATVDDIYTADSFCTVETNNSQIFKNLNLQSNAVFVAWASDTRKGVHVEDLLDVDHQCSGANMYNSVCVLGVEDTSVTSATTMTLRPVNPWAGGEFNALIGCDTTKLNAVSELIDATCFGEICDDFFRHMPSDTCSSRNGLFADEPRHTDAATNNLCGQSGFSTRRTCDNAQGVLNGADGTPVPSLYDPSEFRCGDPVSVFSGEIGREGCLQFDEDDGGVHQIKMVLSGVEAGELKTHRVLLSSKGTLEMVDHVDDWLTGLVGACKEEDSQFYAVYNATHAGGWSAPLQRLAFWTGTHKHKKPLLPDPARSRILYAHLNISEFAHPLQTVSETAWRAKGYLTSNGYCLCKDAESCSVNAVRVSRSHACSVHDSIAALIDSGWRTSTECPTRAADSRDVDWPKVPGNLRDGSPAADSGVDDLRVLQRLPDFNIRFRADAGVTGGPEGKTTLSDGGDCHMGYGASVDTDNHGDISARGCQLVEKTDVAMRFRCGTDEILTVPRDRSKTPPDLLAVMQQLRRRCSACSVPTFDNTQFPDEPEVSFGVPYRLSPVRRWMRSVQEALANTTLSALSPSLKADRKAFVEEHVQKISRQGVASPPPDSRAAFEEDWLFCKRNGNCTGSIPWEEWEPWKGRLTKCMDSLNQLGDAEEFVVPIEMCNVDRSLDTVCSQVQEAKQIVANANCLASGACVPTPFFYAPAVFSVSNNDFVRMTVQSFYEMHDSQICSVDEDNLRLRLQNERLKAACPSVFMEKAKQLLYSLRTVAYTVAQLTVYTLQLILSMLRLLVSFADLDSAINDILKWFNKILVLVVDILVQIAKLVFKIVFEISPLGKDMMAMVVWLCEKLNIVLKIVRIVYCEVIRPMWSILMDVWDGIISFVEGAINILCLGACDFSIPVLHDIVAFMKKALVDGTTDFCSADGDILDCAMLAKEVPDTNPSGALPVSTRCWTDFIPVPGMSMQLSCTRSDSCKVEGLTVLEPVVCDSCPAQDGTAFQDYGCDLLTKMCTCKTQYRSITYCTQNDQCSLDASCLMVDELFASASWGVDMCSNCQTMPVCMYDGSQRLGRCGCPFKDAHMQDCKGEAVGENAATPDFNPAHKNCLYTFSDVQRGGIGYMSMGSLAVVPCDIVNALKVICTVVDNMGVFVVGYEVMESLSGITSSGRRLLALEGMDFFGDNASASHNELAAMVLEFSDWNHTAEPCKSLVAAHRTLLPLGPVDLHKLRSCVFWRTIGKNTPGVPETMLLSGEDFIAASVLNISTPMTLLFALKPLAHNVLMAWPEARAMVEMVRPFIVKNASWVGFLQRAVVWVKEEKRFAPQIEMVKRFAARSLLQVNVADMGGMTAAEITSGAENVNITVADLERRGIDVEALVYQSTDGVETSSISLSQLRAWGVEVGPMLFKEVMELARPQKVPFSMRSSQFMMSAVGGDAAFSAGPRLSDGSTRPSQAPDNFPPTFEYWVDTDGDGKLDQMSCPAVEIFVEETFESAKLLVRVFREGFYRLPLQNRTLAGALPVFAKTPPHLIPEATTVYATTFPMIILRFVKDALAVVVGITPDTIRVFFRCTEDREELTLCNIVKDLISCDMESIQICSRHKRDVVWTAVLMFVLYVILGYIILLMGFPHISTILWLTYPNAVLWWAYGYSVACTPMVPTCFVEDVMQILYVSFPIYVHVPDALQKTVGCWNDSSVPAQNCFKSCITHPDFNYMTLSATAAWASCEWYGPSCKDIRIGFSVPGILDSTTFARDVEHKARAVSLLHDKGLADATTAQRMCFAVGMVITMPYLLLVVVMFYVVTGFMSLPFNIMYSLSQFMLQLVFFTHLRAGEGI